MSEEKKPTIKDVAFMYQASLKANFLPEVFIHAIGSEINQQMVKTHLVSKVDEVLEQLKVIKELLDEGIDNSEQPDYSAGTGKYTS